MDYSIIRTLVHFLFLGVEHLFEEVNQFRCYFDSHYRSEGMIALRNRLYRASNRLHWRKMKWSWLDKSVTGKEPAERRASSSWRPKLSSNSNLRSLERLPAC